MTIVIVDFPIENGGSFHSYVNVYQRLIFGSQKSPPSHPTISQGHHHPFHRLLGQRHGHRPAQRGGGTRWRRHHGRLWRHRRSWGWCRKCRGNRGKGWTRNRFFWTSTCYSNHENVGNIMEISWWEWGYSEETWIFMGKSSMNSEIWLRFWLFSSSETFGSWNFRKSPHPYKWVCLKIVGKKPKTVGDSSYFHIFPDSMLYYWTLGGMPSSTPT